jgi:hypothetical protein
MSVNPYPHLARDKGQTEMQDFAIHASVKATYASENASASSVITLTPDTTALEIVALGAGVTGGVMRWVRTADTQASVISAAGTANFEHVISNNVVRKFAVPIETVYQAPSSLVGANIINGLYRRVAIKSIGVASVLLTEY